MNYFVFYLFILILQFFSTFSQNCPPNCVCKMKTKSVSCKKINLQSIPQNIPTYVEILDLSQNDLEIFPPKSFKTLINLEKLICESCKLKTIFNDTFDGLDKLKYLFLTSNFLENIDSRMFTNLTNLHHLNLRNNKFVLIPNVISSSMTRLNLGENLIENATVGKGFQYNTGLRSLLLNNNKIKSINVNDLSNLKGCGIQSIVLTKNNLELIDKNAFEPVIESLHSLQLDGNPKLTSTILETTLQIFSGKSQLIYLDLKDTGLSRVSRLLLQPFSSSSLNTLDLSNNIKLNFIEEGAFSGLDALQKLYISKCALSSENISLTDLQMLKEVRLNNNGFLKSPTHFPKSVTIISLSHNNISYISEDNFAGLSSLQQLRLDHNVITNIREGSFSGLSSLTKLDLSYNSLDHVYYTKVSQGVDVNLSVPGASIFSQCSSLADLDLSYNQIEVWSYDTFSSLSGSLSSLSLASNKLMNISVNSDKNNYLPRDFNRLKQVYLENNPWNCTCVQVLWILDHKSLLVKPDTILCEYPQNKKGTSMFSEGGMKNCSYTPVKPVSPSGHPKNGTLNKSYLWIIPIILVVGVGVILVIRGIPRKCVRHIRHWRQRRYTVLHEQVTTEPMWLSSLRSSRPDAPLDVVVLSREVHTANDKIKVIDNLQSLQNRELVFHCRILVVDVPPVDEEILKFIVIERKKGMFGDNLLKETFIFKKSEIDFDEESDISDMVERDHHLEYIDIMDKIYSII